MIAFGDDLSTPVADLKKLVARLGGKVFAKKSLDAGVNLLICSSKESDEPSDKALDAKRRLIAVVTEAYLHDSNERMAHIPVTDAYLVDLSAAPGTPAVPG